ncbi:MAG: hypothetical protein PHQ47_01570, partial [Candidatus Portnoybacteria bacterium]|nr:hypothetical protein [Candidatus Portnoybacteria bacterium]
TYTGVIVMLVGFIFKAAQIEMAPEQIQNAVELAVTLVGAIISLYGRYRVGDLKWYGGRK